MQLNPHSLPRVNLQDQMTVMHVERRVFWESLCSATRQVSRKWIVLLDDRRKQKWIWAILLAFASYESYFVRALLATLLFLTILYVVLVALPALYIFVAHAFYSGILLIASARDTFRSLLQHRVASLPEYRSCPRADSVLRQVNPSHCPTGSRRK